MTKNNIFKTIIWILFIFYISVILKLTVFRSGANIRVLNLIPFTMLAKIYKDNGLGYFYYLVLGNIGWFMPFGFMLPLIFKKMNTDKIILAAFLFSLFLEVSQYVLMVGYTELDDVFLNTLGGLLGYICLIKRKVLLFGIPSFHKIHKLPHHASKKL